ncbi:hypothetical protein FB45DRAFT_838338 [Roridomyces roridus]|uniref:C2H2-type domain-containing protein n=1 Tax=Roridomyces roridus TaxID=1738132 RepID=A0AAD7FG05_9AGAR|nr:hypothetical protein FB45DRAFT_838338 [Roridomyces roridus]
MPHCNRCQRHFHDTPALRQHVENSPNHFICTDCNLDFASSNELTQHYIRHRHHHYCQYCDSHFDDARALEAHYQNSHFYCAKCGLFCQSLQALHEHYQHSGLHHYCVPCQRLFQSASNLSTHLNSALHRPRDVRCPGHGCGLTFVSRSALIFHLEAGTCPGGADRRTVEQYVCEYDRQHVITDPARMESSSSTPPTTTYMATSAAWNGSVYGCYLCHRGYRTLAGLNQHLASPRHVAGIYLCPLTACSARFTSLSALCQHIESGSCGVQRFRVVQETMDDLTGRMRRMGTS